MRFGKLLLIYMTTTVKKKVVLVLGSNSQDGRLIRPYFDGLEEYKLILTSRNDLSDPPVIPLDISVQHRVEEVFQEYQPDIVINFAGANNKQVNLTGIGINKFLQTNVVGLENALNSTKDGATFINCSSYLSRVEPRSYYGMSRNLGEELVRAHRGRINASNIILANHESQYRSKDYLAPKIVDQCCKVLLEDEIPSPIHIQNWSKEINWLPATDVVDNIFHLINGGLIRNQDIFILCNGCYTPFDFIESIMTPTDELKARFRATHNEIYFDGHLIFYCNNPIEEPFIYPEIDHNKDLLMLVDEDPLYKMFCLLSKKYER